MRRNSIDERPVTFRRQRESFWICFSSSFMILLLVACLVYCACASDNGSQRSGTCKRKELHRQRRRINWNLNSSAKSLCSAAVVDDNAAPGSGGVAEDDSSSGLLSDETSLLRLWLFLPSTGDEVAPRRPQRRKFRLPPDDRLETFFTEDLSWISERLFGGRLLIIDSNKLLITHRPERRWKTDEAHHRPTLDWAKSRQTPINISTRTLRQKHIFL